MFVNTEIVEGAQWSRYNMPAMHHCGSYVTCKCSLLLFYVFEGLCMSYILGISWARATLQVTVLASRGELQLIINFSKHDSADLIPLYLRKSGSKSLSCDLSNAWNLPWCCWIPCSEGQLKRLPEYSPYILMQESRFVFRGYLALCSKLRLSFDIDPFVKPIGIWGIESDPPCKCWKGVTPPAWLAILLATVFAPIVD